MKRYLALVPNQDDRDLVELLLNKYEHEILPRMRQMKRGKGEYTSATGLFARDALYETAKIMC